MIDGLVAVDGDEVLAWVSSQLAVKVGSRYDGLIVLGEAACGLLDNREDFGHNFVECLLVDVKYFFL